MFRSNELLSTTAMRQAVQDLLKTQPDFDPKGIPEGWIMTGFKAVLHSQRLQDFRTYCKHVTRLVNECPSLIRWLPPKGQYDVEKAMALNGEVSHAEVVKNVLLPQLTYFYNPTVDLSHIARDGFSKSRRNQSGLTTNCSIEDGFLTGLDALSMVDRAEAAMATDSRVYPGRTHSVLVCAVMMGRTLRSHRRMHRKSLDGLAFDSVEYGNSICVFDHRALLPCCIIDISAERPSQVDG